MSNNSYRLVTRVNSRVSHLEGLLLPQHRAEASIGNMQ